VPLFSLFGYVTALRTITEGRGDATMQLQRYAPVPAGMIESVLKPSLKVQV
jgi:elongation factor G